MQRPNSSQQVVANLLTKAEKDYEDLFKETIRSLSGSLPEKIEPERSKEGMKKLVSLMINLGKKLGEYDVALRNRVLKLEIKVTALHLKQLYHGSGNKKAELSSANVQNLIVDVLTRFVNGKKWFHCQDDLQCQRDLFALYELLSMVVHTSFDVYQFLLVLNEKCDDNFFKLSTLQALILEKTEAIERQIAQGKQPESIKAISAFQPECDKAVKGFLAASNREMSLQQTVEQAKGHFVAYRCQTIFFHTRKRKGKPNSQHYLYINRNRKGEHEGICLTPADISLNADFADIKLFMREEKRLRSKHLEPAFALFQALTFDVLVHDMSLVMLHVWGIQEVLEHLQKINQEFVDILESANQKKFPLSPPQVQAISTYCKELTTAQEVWRELFNRYSGTVNEKLKTFPQQSEITYASETISKWQGAVEAPVKQTTATATKAIAEQEAEFARLEKEAGEVKKEFEDWAKAQQERYAAIKAKREAARAQEKPVEKAPKVTIENEDDDEQDNVVVLATVKSDALMRLELHDKKLFEFVDRLLVSTLEIKRIIKTRKISATILPDQDIRSLDIKLKASLTDYAALVALRERFVKLKASLASEEQTELADGISASMERAEQAERQIFRMLNDATNSLQQIHEDIEADRKRYIEGLGKKMVGDDVEALSQKEIFALGWTEFVRRGRANREKGFPLSDAALERRYLRACYKTYHPRLQEILQTRAEAISFTPKEQVSYSTSIQAAWAKLRGIPGETFLFGGVLIDLLRSRKAIDQHMVLPVFHFVSSCKHANEVLDVRGEFEVSADSDKQCSLKNSNGEAANIYLMGGMAKENNTTPLFFTIDFVMSDENGNLCDLAVTGLEDIKDGVLRSFNDPALTLREKPAALLYALLHMAKGFMPDDKLMQALYDWQPSPEMNVDYLKSIAFEHLKQLLPEEQLCYVNQGGQYGILKKLFGLDAAALQDENALQMLRRLTTPPPSHSPRLFTPTIPPSNKSQPPSIAIKATPM